MDWCDPCHLSYLSPFDRLGAPLAVQGHFPLVPSRNTRAWEPWGYGPIHGMARLTIRRDRWSLTARHAHSCMPTAHSPFTTGSPPAVSPLSPNGIIGHPHEGRAPRDPEGSVYTSSARRMRPRIMRARSAWARARDAFYRARNESQVS